MGVTIGKPLTLKKLYHEKIGAKGRTRINIVQIAESSSEANVQVLRNKALSLVYSTAENHICVAQQYTYTRGWSTTQ